jgi:4-hydroxybenzoate polyprenyltransferase
LLSEYESRKVQKVRKISALDLLFGFAAPKERTTKNRILGFIELQRAAVVAMGVPFALAGAMLAERQLGMKWNQVFIQDFYFLFFGLLAVWLLVSSMHVFNDILDAKRDVEKFPMRPLPTGLVKRWEAAMYALVMTGVALAIAYFVFNWTCLLISVLVLALGTVYTKYTRDKVGFLTVAFVPGLIVVGGWAAVSPTTVLTPFPWLLYIFALMHQTAHIIACEAHVPAKLFLVRPKPNTEAIIYGACMVSMFFIGLYIYVLAEIHWLFLVMLSIITILGLFASTFLKEPRTLERGKKAFVSIVIYGLTYWMALSVFAII